MTEPGESRCFRIHPAFGIREAAPGPLFPYSDDELGAAWSVLDDQERDASEARFFTEVFRFLIARHGRVSLRVDLPLREERTRFLEDAEVSDVEVLRGAIIRGTLTHAAAEILVQLNPVELDVRAGDSTLLRLHDAWTGVEVWLESDGALSALSRHLRAAGFPAPSPGDAQPQP